LERVSNLQKYIHLNQCQYIEVSKKFLQRQSAKEKILHTATFRKINYYANLNCFITKTTNLTEFVQQQHQPHLLNNGAFPRLTSS